MSDLLTGWTSLWDLIEQRAGRLADAIRREDLIGGSLYDFRTTTDPKVWEALRKIS